MREEIILENGLTASDVLDTIIDGYYRNVPHADKDDFARKIATGQKRLLCLEAMHEYGKNCQSDIQSNLNDAIDLLDECRLQLEYLNGKFGKTGTTENILGRITTFLKS